MSRCEESQLELSAFVDGEASGEELARALDHMTGCATCQRFYQDSRRLNEVVSSSHAAGSARSPRATVPRERGQASRAWRIAALIVLAVGLTVLGWDVVSKRPAPTSTRNLVVQLEGERGKMSEERFVEITVELLGSDRRFQNKMLQILEQVSPEGGPAEDGLPDGVEDPPEVVLGPKEDVTYRVMNERL